MARYYDLDKLSKLIEAKADTMLEGKGAMLYVAKWLNLLPTADVEKVCHCGKCKYSKTHTCAITGIKTLFCDYGEKPVAVEPTHYCGYGERRRDNDIG